MRKYIVLGGADKELVQSFAKCIPPVVLVVKMRTFDT